MVDAKAGMISSGIKGCLNDLYLHASAFQNSFNKVMPSAHALVHKFNFQPMIADAKW